MAVTISLYDSDCVLTDRVWRGLNDLRAATSSGTATGSGAAMPAGAADR